MCRGTVHTWLYLRAVIYCSSWFTRHSCKTLSTCVNKDNKNNLSRHFRSTDFTPQADSQLVGFPLPKSSHSLWWILSYMITDLCRHKFLSSGIYLVLNKCHLESVMTGCRMVNVEDSRLSLPRSQNERQNTTVLFYEIVCQFLLTPCNLIQRLKLFKIYKYLCLMIQ